MSQDLQDQRDRQDEVEALQAIFSDDFRQFSNDTFEIKVNSSLSIRICLPDTYPSRCGPLYELLGPSQTSEQILHLSNELDQIASHGSGDVVVFKLIEFLRDHALPETSHDFQSDTFAPRDSYEIDDNGGDDDGCEADAPDANSLSISNELAPPQVHEKWTACIVSGEILVDRKSTFQAHLAPVQSANDVAELLLVLKSNNKIARATHNIMAYRIVRKEGGVVSDCDDDGESAAGGRLLHLLSILDVRDVCVVVSRWYGGVQLGPDRFKHINNVARTLLVERGYVAAPSDSPADHARRRR